ncbi:hypothetical protein [Streptomyces sp. NPDC058664]|uniref:phage tail protein n=1 Tax=unclassified Streptomyces TaxID=2593676 RepID=UPI00364827F5
MAANQAEVDLVVSAAGALPDLERQLSQIVRTAEDRAPEVDVQASLAVQNSIAVMSTQLDQVLRQVDASDPSIDVEAALDAQASLRGLRQDLDELTRRATSGATDIIELEAALDFPRSLAEVTAAINDLVTDVEAIAPEIEVEVEVDTDEVPRAERALRALGRTSLTTAKGVGTLTQGVAGLSLAVGGGATTVATLVTALQQVAPAAAVGTSAMLTQKLAAGTLKLAMIGVEDAIKDAFDPELSPDEFHKSLKNLAPEARLFVDALHTIRRELKAVQQGVQNRVFKDFDGIVANLAKNLGPTLTRSLNRAADSLNAMGRNAATAALQLQEQGVLGKALAGANSALERLEATPARVVRSFGFLAAASSPALNRIATAVDDVSLRIQEKLQRAFESGALEQSIDQAVSLIAELGTVLGNFGAGVQNIFAGLTQNGGGLFEILGKVSEAFERLTASQEFQTILNELALTAGVLVDNILPLIQEAFVQLAPVIEELAPVVRDFVTAIGPELIPVIQELGPILVDIALILREQLPLAINLASAVLEALVIVLQGVGWAMDLLRQAAGKLADFMESDYGRALGASSAFTLLSGEKIKQSFSDWTSSAYNSITQFLGNLIDFNSKARATLVGGFQSMYTDLMNNLQGFLSSFGQAFSGLPSRLYQIGLEIMSGLASGLTAGIGRVIGIAQGIADSVVSTIKGALDIQSPSRVMKKIGQDTVAGYVQGINAKLPDLEATMEKLSHATKKSVKPRDFSATFGRIDRALSPLLMATRESKNNPVVNVYLGNELLYQVINTQVRTAMNRRDRTLSQGVRI